MGVFCWPVRLATIHGGITRAIEDNVDTAAGFSVVPEGLLKEIGIAPNRRSIFGMVDGQRGEYEEIGPNLEGDSLQISNSVFGSFNARTKLS